MARRWWGLGWGGSSVCHVAQDREGGRWNEFHWDFCWVSYRSSLSYDVWIIVEPGVQGRKKIGWRYKCYRVERLPWWLRGRRICLQCRRPGFDPWVGKIPWRRSIIEYYSVQYLPGKESPCTEEPAGLQTTGLQRVGHNWAIFTFHFSSSCPFQGYR